MWIDVNFKGVQDELKQVRMINVDVSVRHTSIHHNYHGTVVILHIPDIYHKTGPIFYKGRDIKYGYKIGVLHHTIQIIKNGGNMII